MTFKNVPFIAQIPVYVACMFRYIWNHVVDSLYYQTYVLSKWNNLEIYKRPQRGPTYTRR